MIGLALISRDEAAKNAAKQIRNWRTLQAHTNIILTSRKTNWSHGLNKFAPGNPKQEGEEGIKRPLDVRR